MADAGSHVPAAAHPGKSQEAGRKHGQHDGHGNIAAAILGAAAPIVHARIVLHFHAYD